MIPKKIHLSWVDKNIINNHSELIKNGLSNLIKLNLDWSYEISINDEVNEYLYSHMELNDFKMIENDKIVAKTDIWRLIKLYIEGGVYLDIDRYCNISFDNILNENIKCVLPTCLDYGFSQDFMMSEPNNPIYQEAYNLLISRRIHTDNVYFLGPQTYMHAVTKSITGNIIDINPGFSVMDNLRKTIDQMGFILTYRENLPYDSIINKSPLQEISIWENQKRELYSQYNLKHWTGEW